MWQMKGGMHQKGAVLLMTLLAVQLTRAQWHTGPAGAKPNPRVTVIPPPENVLRAPPPLALTTSPVPSHTLTMHRKPSDQACRKAPMDVVFALDGSISDEAFSAVQLLVLNLVNNFDVGPQATRVGLVQYADQPRTEFPLDKHATKEALRNAIKELTSIRGHAATGRALRHLVERSFSSLEGARPLGLGIRRLIVLLSSGRSIDDAVGPARDVHRAGLLLYTVDVDGARESLMHRIASKPSCVFVHSIGNPGRLLPKICEGVMCPGKAGKDSAPGVDLLESFALDFATGVDMSEGSTPGRTAFHVQRTAKLTHDLRHLLPHGLPTQFSLIVTLQLPGPGPIPEPTWTLWRARFDGIRDALALRVDGTARSIEISSETPSGRSESHVFRGFDSLFDGNWHKLALAVQDGRVSLFVDCHEEGTEGLEVIDGRGGFMDIALRGSGEGSAPVQLQQFDFFCNPERAGRETCCELPGKCTSREQAAPPEGPCECKVGCTGLLGFPGIKGQKGNKGQAGPLGKQGRKGIRGVQGVEGMLGQPGTRGDTGDHGRTGDRGFVGPKGFQGKLGPQGIQGHEGEKGSDGLIGPKGDKGLDADPGDPGMRGEDGKDGPPGKLGDHGFMGEDGPDGHKGEKGAEGKSGLTGLIGDRGYPGFPGPAGTRGEKGEKNLPGPAGAPGVDGAFGKDGLLGLPGLTGPMGPQGSQGDHGEQGNIGPQGLPGLRGKVGDRGLWGRKGKIGRPGPPGLPGAIGDIGGIGAVGDIGQVGVQGHTGPQGEMGSEGDRGKMGQRSLPGPHGQLGARGGPGSPGKRGEMGQPGDTGKRGERGERGHLGPPGPPMDDSVVEELCRRVVTDQVSRHAAALRRACSDACGPGGQGPIGATGPPGDPGLPGNAGDPGLVGFDGQPGVRGLTGEQGPEGDVGLRGETGVAGVKGEQGLGRAGVLGPQGIPGSPGIPSYAKDGIPGPNGPPGYTGAAGPPGQPGLPGGRGLCEARDCGVPPLGLRDAMGVSNRGGKEGR